MTHDAPSGSLGQIALTTAVLVGGVMVPTFLVQAIAFGYGALLNVFGWQQP